MSEQKISTEDYGQILSIFDSMDEPIYVSDPDSYELLYINKALSNRWGNCTGKKCYKALQKLDAPCQFCTNDRIFGKETEKEVIWEFQNKVTQEWFRCIDRAIRWTDGRMVRFEMAVNINDLKITEQKLRDSKNDMLCILNSINDRVVYLDADLKIIKFNHAVATHTGETAGNTITGRKCYEALMDRSEPCVGCPALITIETEKLEEADIKTSDGKLWNTRAYPTTGQDRKVTGVVGIGRDITDHRKAEDANKRLATAVANASESLVITDQEATIIYVNPAFEQNTGYTKEEAVGQNPSILKTDRQDAAFYKEMWNLLSAGKVWKGEFVNKKKDGTFFTEEATISPVFDRDGQIINYVAIKYDVTEKRALENQLNHALKMEAIGRLAGGVAHDFNNMLNVILGYSEIITSKFSPNDPVLKDLIEIKNAARRSVDITRQLLAFSRKQIIAPRVIDMNKTIEGMEKMLARVIGEDIDILFVPGENLWKVRLDPSMVDQIIANLVINARDAMKNGGKLTIETLNGVIDKAYCTTHAGFIPGNFAMLAVSDNGTGMDKETMSHVFEPFFTTKDKAEGTGLGLSSVYGSVKQSNGFINVYSEPGKGTTFKLYFPQYHGKTKKTEIETDVLKKFKTATVVLVEDDEMLLNLAKTMLEYIGHNVVAFANPNDALAFCDKSKSSIDILLTDIVMPDMNGRKLRDLIVAENPEIRTIFMSGYTANVIAHQGILEKEVSFLQKPFTMDDLAKKIEEILKK